MKTYSKTMKYHYFVWKQKRTEIGSRNYLEPKANREPKPQRKRVRGGSEM